MVTRSLNNNQQNPNEDIFQCVRIRPHSSSLKNAENSTTCVSQCRFAVEKRKKKKIMAIAKLSALYADQINISNCSGGKKYKSPYMHKRWHLYLIWTSRNEITLVLLRQQQKKKKKKKKKKEKPGWYLDSHKICIAI